MFVGKVYSHACMFSTSLYGLFVWQRSNMCKAVIGCPCVQESSVYD